MDELARAVRMTRLMAVAERTFGSADKATRWMNRPLAGFSGYTPLRLAETEAGARVVESYLDKIAWGAAG